MQHEWLRACFLGFRGDIEVATDELIYKTACVLATTPGSLTAYQVKVLKKFIPPDLVHFVTEYKSRAKILAGARLGVPFEDVVRATYSKNIGSPRLKAVLMRNGWHVVCQGIMRSRWKESEIALLGTDSDEAVAALLGRSFESVRTARTRRKIPLPENSSEVKMPATKSWRPWEVSLLGTMSDGAVALATGRSKKAVISARERRNIPIWTETENESSRSSHTYDPNSRAVCQGNGTDAHSRGPVWDGNLRNLLPLGPA